jgi:hypothetical protein
MPRKPIPELPPVAFFDVAPYRYGYHVDHLRDVDVYSWRAVKDAAPYKPGDVVYVIDGEGGFRRAYVVRVDADKKHLEDWQEYYWVRPETKGGTFARREYIAHPGYVQRGYQRALGLDDCDRPRKKTA